MDYNFNGRILQNGQPIGGGGESPAEFDISSLILTGGGSSLSGRLFNGTDNTLYSSFVKDGSTLKLVISGYFQRDNQCDTSTSYTIISNQSIETLGSDILSKIYRADGTNLTQAPVLSTNLVGITVITPYALIGNIDGNNNFDTSSGYCILSSTEANKITLKFKNVAKALLSTAANNWFFDLRTFLTIL